MESLIWLLFGFICYFLGVLIAKDKKRKFFPLFTKYKKIPEIIFKSYADYSFIIFASTTIIIFLLFGYLYLEPRGFISKADVVQTLIFGATFYTLFYSVIIKDKPSKFRERPILNLNFNFEEPDCHLTTAHIGQIDLDIESYYIRFRVENLGKTTIRNAQVILERVEMEEGIVSTFVPLNLVWALTENQLNRGIVDIPQGVFRTVDMLKILNPEQSLLAQGAFSNNNNILAERFNRLANGIGVVGVSEPNNFSDILPFGNYTLYITLSAENTPPLFVRFTVRYTGDWSREPETMFSRNLRVEHEG